MKINFIKETCLYVSDLHNTRAFYEGKLGLEMFALAEGRHIFFRAGESVLLCFLPEVTKGDSHLPPHYGYGKLHLAFQVDKEEYGDWKDKISKAGIDIIHEEPWPGDYQSFYFHDPDGHVLEIVQKGMWD